VKRSQGLPAAVAFALTGLLTHGRAAAQAAPPPEATRFVFKAPDGCGSAQDFSTRVARRSSRILLVPGAAARSLFVEIQPPDAAGTLRGRVTVVEADGATRARQLKAKSCEEALDALSLIATVTLDPEAFMAEPAEEPAPAPATKPPEPATKPPERRPPPFPVAPRELYRVSFGIGPVLLLRIAPEPAPGAQITAALEMNPGAMLSPFWRLAVLHSQRRGLAAPGGEANFAYTLPTIELCPVRFGPELLGIRPCGFASLGAVKAWGEGALRTEDHLRKFGAGGPSLLVSLRLSKALEIIVDERVGFAFWRDSYGFDDVVFFKTLTPGFSTGLGVAGGFP
jgi:hypothetical protein